MFGKILLPYAVCAYVFFVFVDIAVNNVITVGAFNVGTERKVNYLVVLT